MDKKKWIWVGGAVGAIAALSWLGLSYMAQKINVGQLLADEARTRYGRDLIVGSVEWSVLPAPRIKLVQVVLSNPAAKGRAAMAQLDSAQAWVSVSALVRGELRLTRARVDGLTVRVGADEHGVDDWKFDGKSVPAGPSSEQEASGAEAGPGALSEFAELTLDQAAVEKVMGKAGERAERYEIESATAKRADGSAKIQAKALVGGQSLFIVGAVAADKDGLALNADIKAKDWGVVVSGSGSGLASFRLTLSAAGRDAGAVERLWRRESVASGAFEAKAVVEKVGAQLRVEKLEARWGGWSAAGSVKMDLSKSRPTANVSLRFAGVGMASGAALAAPAETLGSNENESLKKDGAMGLVKEVAIPWGVLDAADVFGDVEVDELPMGGVRLSNVRASIDLRSGALRLDPVRAELAGGLVSGRGVSNAKSRAVGFTGTLSGTSAEAVEAAMGAGKALIGGPMTIHADLRTSGATKKEMMANLAGSASVEMGKSRLASSGASRLVSAMGGLFPALGARSGVLDLDCVGARMTIANGVGSGSPIVGVEGPSGSALASGLVDFQREVVDLGFDVRVMGRLDGANLSALASAVRVSGPWSGPRVGVDAARASAGLAAIGAAMGEGGLSALAKMIGQKSAGGANACLVALGRVQNAATGSPAVPPATKGDPAGAASPLSALKRLFGQ